MGSAPALVPTADFGVMYKSTLLPPCGIINFDGSVDTDFRGAVLVELLHQILDLSLQLEIEFSSLVFPAYCIPL